jgi:hypothetical protein
MDFKLILSVTVILLTVFVGHIPYLVGMFKGKIKPHIYSWLIWTITFGIATLGVKHGEGGWGVLSMSVGLFFVFIIFLSCFKYGTRNITKFDTVMLFFALLAVVVWFQLHNPLLAVFMATAIDFIGYIPSFRKSFQDPWSESVVVWSVFTIAGLLAILSLNEYNLLTLTYLVITEIANLILIGICLVRRRYSIIK